MSVTTQPVAPVAPRQRVLLVTGSRCLADSPLSEAWARERLYAAMVRPGGWLFTGDARGPDAWAVEVAQEMDWSTARWKLDGLVVSHHALPGGVVGSGWKHWAPAEVAAARRDDRRWPLERNRALVDAAAHAAAKGWDVRVLALVAPWATTAGTAFTARLARKRGLSVDLRTAPEVGR